MDSSARACAAKEAQAVTERTRSDWCEMDWIYRAKVEMGEIPSLTIPFHSSTETGDDLPDETLEVSYSVGLCTGCWTYRSASGSCLC